MSSLMSLIAVIGLWAGFIYAFRYYRKLNKKYIETFGYSSAREFTDDLAQKIAKYK